MIYLERNNRNINQNASDQKSSLKVGVLREKSLRASSFRWIALFLASFISFGSYFCYDYPNALSDLIKLKMTNVRKSKIFYRKLI